MVTGLEDTTSIETAFSVGATDFTGKPLNWTVLPHRLRYMLRASETLGPLAQSRAELERAQQIAGLGSWEWSVAQSELRLMPQARNYLGLSPEQSAVAMDAFLAQVPDADQSRVEAWFLGLTEPAAAADMIHLIQSPNGEVRYVQHRAELPDQDADHPSTIPGTIQDVTGRERATRKIHRLAYFDGLPQLPNREAFKEQLHQVLAMAKR